VLAHRARGVARSCAVFAAAPLNLLSERLELRRTPTGGQSSTPGNANAVKERWHVASRVPATSLRCAWLCITYLPGPAGRVQRRQLVFVRQARPVP
jgi:hypothetical protein